VKVSIVLPVYNGEETLEECLEAILNIDYPKSNYELVVVNDGSKDSTEQIIKEFIPKYNSEGVDINFINFEKNKGRIKARMAGAKNAKHDNLLFIDHRCIASKNILKEIEKKSYEPIIGNPTQDYKVNLISRFFYIFRKNLYRPYWGEVYPDVYIDEENFDSIAKGFSPFFTKKERFFKAIPEDTSKWVSDDTLIFSNIVKEKKILKTSTVRVLYKERYGFKEFFGHMFQRGPKFVDFYWNPKSRYFFLIPLICVLPLIFGGGILLLGGWFGIAMLVSLLIVLGYLLLKGYELLDILSVLAMTPLVLLAFGSGVYIGVFRKVLRLEKK
jgi:glycosyltransferase involved in cell wall biosynthesis